MPGAISVGTKVQYQYETGKFVPAFIIEYVEGRPEGDYFIGGFNVHDSKGGDVFRVWSVVGTTQGSFKVKGS
jgi:hypothetical protein